MNVCMHCVICVRFGIRDVHMKLMGKTELVPGKAAQGRQYFSYRLK